jgi:hypothetical protein
MKPLALRTFDFLIWHNWILDKNLCPNPSLDDILWSFRRWLGDPESKIDAMVQYGSTQSTLTELPKSEDMFWWTWVILSINISNYHCGLTCKLLCIREADVSIFCSEHGPFCHLFELILVYPTVAWKLPETFWPRGLQHRMIRRTVSV